MYIYIYICNRYIYIYIYICIHIHTYIRFYLRIIPVGRYLSFQNPLASAGNSSEIKQMRFSNKSRLFDCK